MANEDDTAHSSEMISQVSAAGSDEPQQSSSPPQAPSTPASNATVSRANEITEEMRQQWMPFIESIAVEGTLPKSDGSWHTLYVIRVRCGQYQRRKRSSNGTAAASTMASTVTSSTSTSTTTTTTTSKLSKTMATLSSLLPSSPGASDSPSSSTVSNSASRSSFPNRDHDDDDEDFSDLLLDDATQPRPPDASSVERALHRSPSTPLAAHEADQSPPTGASSSAAREWVVYRRFREFALLDASLRQREMVSHPWPTLPTEKTWFPIGIMEPEFIEKRRVALEQYLQALIDVPDLHRTCAHYVAFLTQDKHAIVPTVVEYDSLEEPQLSPIDTQHLNEWRTMTYVVRDRYSTRPGYAGFLEESHDCLSAANAVQQTRRHIGRTFGSITMVAFSAIVNSTMPDPFERSLARAAASQFRWMTGPANVEPENSKTVSIPQCRFRQLGGERMCQTLCKQPMEEYYLQSVGVPVDFQPARDSLACSITFGARTLTPTPPVDVQPAPAEPAEPAVTSF